MAQVRVGRGQRHVAELALNDRHFDALHHEFVRVRVSKAMRMDPFGDAGLPSQIREDCSEVAEGDVFAVAGAEQWCVGGDRHGDANPFPAVHDLAGTRIEPDGSSPVERFHRKRIMTKPHKHVSFQFPSRDIGELRQQILEERAAGWHWTDSGAMTVALMHYLGRGHPFERLTIDAALTDPTLVTRLEAKATQQGRTVTGVVLELILGYLDAGDEPEWPGSSSGPSPGPQPPSTGERRRDRQPGPSGPDTPTL